MFNKNKSILRIFIFLFILTFFQFQVSPQIEVNNRIIVLPFHIDNEIPVKHNFLNFTELSSDFEIASIFLLKTNFYSKVLNFEDTKKILNISNFDEKSLLNKIIANNICKQSQANFLVSGSVIIPNREISFLKVISYNCNNEEISKSDNTKLNSKAEIQSTLQNSLSKVLPNISLKENFSKKEALSTEAKNKNLILILDLSGSMRSEIKLLLNELIYLKNYLPQKTKLSAILIQKGDEVSTINFSSNWNNVIQKIRKKNITGETTVSSLIKVMDILEKMNSDYNNIFTLFLTDINVNESFFNKIYPNVRSLLEKGLSFNFLTLATQNKQTRNFWNKLRKYTENGLTNNYQTLLNKNNNNLKNELIYTQKYYFAERGETIFVQKGDLFFISKENEKLSQKEILSNKEEIFQNLNLINTYDYKSEDLNLENLPIVFSNNTKDKIISREEKKSNIGLYLLSLLQDFTTNNKVANSDFDKGNFYRMLVKNGNNAFWINIDSKITSNIDLYQKNPNPNFLLGLHYKIDEVSGKYINLTKPFYVSNFNQVPKLFLWEYNEIQNSYNKKIKLNDVLFMNLELLEIKDNNNFNDIRN